MKKISSGFADFSTFSEAAPQAYSMAFRLSKSKQCFSESSKDRETHEVGKSYTHAVGLSEVEHHEVFIQILLTKFDHSWCRSIDLKTEGLRVTQRGWLASERAFPWALFFPGCCV